MEGVLGGLIAALVGGVSGHVAALLSNIIERRKVIDESVRNVRTANYAVLWRKTALIPKWPRGEDVTYRDILRLSKDLRTWYFGDGHEQPTPQATEDQAATSTKDKATAEGKGSTSEAPGGMYLSAAARRAYGNLQDILTGVVAAQQSRTGGTEQALSTADYDKSSVDPARCEQR